MSESHKKTKVLNAGFLARLSAVNRAIRALRSTGYRVVAQELAPLSSTSHICLSNTGADISKTMHLLIGDVYA